MRIEAKTPNNAALWFKPFFWSQRRKYGAPLISSLAWARAPKLFFGVAVLYGMIDRRSSPVEPPLRSLITVRVSQINGCSFCVDINSATLLKRGVTVEKVAALPDYRTSALYDDRERTVLDYAEAVTRSDMEVDDALMARLKTWFDDDGIVELTGLIAFQNMSSKFNNALDVPSQGFCAMPRRNDR